MTWEDDERAEEERRQRAIRREAAARRRRLRFWKHAREWVAVKRLLLAKRSILRGSLGPSNYRTPSGTPWFRY